MVLQFGLAHLDRYFLTKSSQNLEAVQGVHDWLVESLRDSDYLDNYFPVFDPSHDYHSANSAMAQGQVLSFLCRLIAHLPDHFNSIALTGIADRVRANMILPLDHGGTSVMIDGAPRYCETCRVDGNVIYNGWVFAVFGLHDYQRIVGEGQPDPVYVDAERSLRRSITGMLLDDGWSCYDTAGTLASPFYQDLHMALVEAMARLTSISVYDQVHERLTAGARPDRKLKYMLRKGLEKIRQDRMYTGEG